MTFPLYPYKFTPIYKEKIWGGRNLERLLGRALPAGKNIGESWELADLPEGVSLVANGPAAGTSLTQLTRQLGPALLSRAAAMPDGRFPLLLKMLDANDILSRKVHPDERAVREIGPEAALKTECWYIVESRDGFIYKGVQPGVTAEQFRRSAEADDVAGLVRRIDVRTGDFHYLPAGLVHAIGPGLVVAEVQTPSDTTYRVTDWGRGREVQVERSMQCIRLGLTGDDAPGAGGERLLATEYFAVDKRHATPGNPLALPAGRCSALMVLAGAGRVCHRGPAEPGVPFVAGDTLLLPAYLQSPVLVADSACTFLEATLPDR